jgi:hypothetical protein
MNKANNIFAIEGEWGSRLTDNRTIKSTLTLLNEVRGIDYIFRKVNTEKSLISYLSTSSGKSYKKYGVIVIASHGSRHDIELSQDETIEIEKLADKCADFFEGKTVHFSSCAVARDSNKLKYFKKITKAKAVSGYSKNVGFLESSLLDMAYLDKLHSSNSIKVTENQLNRNYPELINRLGLKIL